MTDKFEVQPYTSADKEILILGHGVKITVDYDDVDRALVDRLVKQIAAILNATKELSRESV